MKAAKGLVAREKDHMQAHVAHQSNCQSEASTNQPTNHSPASHSPTHCIYLLQFFRFLDLFVYGIILYYIYISLYSPRVCAPVHL